MIFIGGFALEDPNSGWAGSRPSAAPRTFPIMDICGLTDNADYFLLCGMDWRMVTAAEWGK